MYKLRVIEHFDKGDEECGGDYHYVTVDLNGKQVVEFGDDYHDKGQERAESWIQGFIFAHRTIKDKIEVLETQYINDSEY